jgi:hypothetical protein
MYRSPLVMVFASALAMFVLPAGARAQAQSQDSAQSPAPAQDASAQPPATPASAATKPAANEKKVWTEEDLKKMDQHEGVSTVGKSDPEKAAAAKAKSNGQNHDPQWYKTQIAKLQDQLDSTNKKIDEISATINGKPTGDGVQSTRPAGVRWDSWQNELADLQKKRDDFTAQIAALQDQARHAGVSTNAIP